MITTFTENDLLRYVYGEFTELEKTNLEKALVCDAELEARYSDLKLDTGLLDGLFFDPQDFSLERIFNFSAQYSMDS